MPNRINDYLRNLAKDLIKQYFLPHYNKIMITQGFVCAVLRRFFVFIIMLWGYGKNALIITLFVLLRIVWSPQGYAIIFLFVFSLLLCFLSFAIMMQLSSYFKDKISSGSDLIEVEDKTNLEYLDLKNPHKGLFNFLNKPLSKEDIYLMPRRFYSFLCSYCHINKFDVIIHTDRYNSFKIIKFDSGHIVLHRFCEVDSKIICWQGLCLFHRNTENFVHAITVNGNLYYVDEVYWESFGDIYPVKGFYVVPGDGNTLSFKDRFYYLLRFWPNVKERALQVDKLISKVSFEGQDEVYNEVYTFFLGNIEEKNYKQYYYFLVNAYIELSKEQYLKGLKFCIYFCSSVEECQYWLNIVNVQPSNFQPKPSRFLIGFQQIFKQYKEAYLFDFFLSTRFVAAEKFYFSALVNLILKYFKINQNLTDYLNQRLKDCFKNSFKIYLSRRFFLFFFFDFLSLSKRKKLIAKFIYQFQVDYRIVSRLILNEKVK